MVWFYTRERQALTIETRYDNGTREFVAIVTGLGGPQMTKRFSTPEAFRDWVETIEQRLATQHWSPDGPPHILPDGWPDKPWSL